jgi:glutaredoxin
MYGADWCSDCRRSKSLLDRLEVSYDYVEADATGADRAFAVSGRTSIPVVVFPDGEFQVEPSDAELRLKLETIGAV